MFEYFAAMIAFFSIYRGMTIVLKRHMDFHPKKIIKEAHPIHIKKGKTGVLLIHGFTSSPYEFKNLAGFLAEKGLTVYAPLIEGHGTSPENLATTNDDGWLDSTRKALKKLKRECGRTYIVGNSLGGNIGICLASENRVDGLILLAPPIYFRKERFLRASFQIMRLLKNFQKKWKHKTMNNIILKKGSYDKIPLNTIKYVTRLVKKSKRSLIKTNVPTLIMQSTDDIWVHEKSVRYIEKHIGTNNKKTVWINNAYHVFIKESNEGCYEEIYSFIEQNEKGLEGVKK